MNSSCYEFINFFQARKLVLEKPSPRQSFDGFGHGRIKIFLVDCDPQGMRLQALESSKYIIKGR